LDALTSAEVVDGTLNRIPIIFLEDDPPLRPTGDIRTIALPPDLSKLVARASDFVLVPTGETTPGAYVQPTRRKTFRDRQVVTIGNQAFARVVTEPGALATLDAFRHEATLRARADERLGPLWSRAFEHSVRAAGVVAVGEACVDYGPLLLREHTARWAIALVRHSIETTVRLLHGNLADTPSERTRLRIMKHAWTLSETARTDPDPVVENSAPPDKQNEIRDLKRTGWFPKSALIRRAHHQGCSARDLASELQGLVEAELMAAHAVEWKTSTGRREKRDFFRPLETLE
jgi:hypothetical protein